MRTAIIIFATGLTFLIAWLFLFKWKKPIQTILLGAVLVFGLLFNVILVPGIIPDEPAHIETAYRYSNLMLFLPYSTEDGGLLVRQGDDLNEFRLFGDSYSESYQNLEEHFAFFCTGEDTALVETTGRDVRTGFIAYLPGAIGFTIARLLHLGTIPMVYLGRLCNLLFYFLCLYWALRITPVKKNLFALIGILPMGMQLACSLSYDVPMLGLSFLFISYGLRLIYVVPKLVWKDWVICGAFALLLAPCKLIFFPLMLLLFLISHQKFGSKLQKAAFLLAVFLAALLSFALSNLDSITMYFKDLGVDKSSTDNQRYQELYTLGWIVGHPKETVQIFLHTIRQDFDFFWKNMLGGRLSVFDPIIDWHVILLVALVFAAQKDPADTIRLSASTKAVGVFGFVIALLSVMLMMLFMYTPFGREVIEGVQGRYLLPILPVFMLALSSEEICLTEVAKRWLGVIVITINGAAVVEIWQWILQKPPLF
ncbi:MAG: DUF2142 domain-containing protein [Eubacteriales bacterium]|nr:DUF2142 domain-containing protein [Eubacteriales bacterium]